MSNTYKTSLTIQFGESAAGVDFSAEVDSRENGYNKGKTTFSPSAPGKPGDNAYFLVFLADKFAITPYSSAGAVVYQETRLIEYTETLTFTDSQASTSKPIESIAGRRWVGVNGGALTFDVGTKSIKCADGVKVAVAQISYLAKARVYYLSAPDKSVLGDVGQVAVLLEAN